LGITIADKRAILAFVPRGFRAENERAIALGWLWRLESGTYVNFTDGGAAPSA
jgi:hypothetical protein